MDNSSNSNNQNPSGNNPSLQPSIEPNFIPPQQTNPQDTPPQQPQTPPIPQVPTEPMPTFTPPGSISFSPQPAAKEQEQQNPASEGVEPAPTDLSQLTENLNQNSVQNNNNNNEVYTPVNNTDTLVISNQASQTTPTTITPEPKKSPPIKLIIGAALILLLVTIASAYFILGIGQPAKTTQISTPKPEPTIQKSSSDETSEEDLETEEGSGSFGAINGTTGSSAIDLLRQRQQSQSSPSASPNTEE